MKNEELPLPTRRSTVRSGRGFKPHFFSVRIIIVNHKNLHLMTKFIFLQSTAV